MLSTDAELSDLTPEEIVADILETVPGPTGDPEPDVSAAVGDGGESDGFEFSG